MIETILITGTIAFIKSAFEIMKFIVETVLAIGTVSIAWIAYRQGKKNNDRHNELIEKINSKEHEVTENLKYEVLELIAVLKAIDLKADYNSRNETKKDYSFEFESLLRLQSRPEFLLFLKSLKFENSGIQIEETLQLLTSPSNDETRIRDFTHIILNIIESDLDIDKAVKQIGENYNKKWGQLVKDLCNVSDISLLYYNDRVIEMIDEGLVNYLVEKKNIDIACFKELFKESGGSVSLVHFVRIMNLDYSLLFELSVLCRFINYLVEEEHIKDEEILKYYQMPQKDELTREFFLAYIAILCLTHRYWKDFVSFYEKKLIAKGDNIKRKYDYLY